MKVRFATSNPHKVREACRVGVEFGVEFVQIKQPYPEVRDEDVKVVAREGARFVFDEIRQPVITEDTGLFIKALRGFPGSYSAFVYGKIGCDGILRLLSGEKNRDARFISAIGYCDGKDVWVFGGHVEGTITYKPSGNGGFGYDPIFTPRGHDKTFAEDPELKNRVSHRTKAFQEFCRWYAQG